MADRRGDSNAVRRFFRAMEKSSKIAGMIMSVILIFVAVSIFVTAFHTSQEAACETPAFPAAHVCPRCHITLEREFLAYCDRCGQHLGWKGYRNAKIVYPWKRKQHT